MYAEKGHIYFIKLVAGGIGFCKPFAVFGAGRSTVKVDPKF